MFRLILRAKAFLLAVNLSHLIFWFDVHPRGNLSPKKLAILGPLNGKEKEADQNTDKPTESYAKIMISIYERILFTKIVDNVLSAKNMKSCTYSTNFGLQSSTSRTLVPLAFYWRSIIT